MFKYEDLAKLEKLGFKVDPLQKKDSNIEVLLWLETLFVNKGAARVRSRWKNHVVIDNSKLKLVHINPSERTHLYRVDYRYAHQLI